MILLRTCSEVDGQETHSRVRVRRYRFPRQLMYAWPHLKLSLFCDSLVAVYRFLALHVPRQLRMLFLLTLASTTKFYEKNGFAIIPPSEVPGVLKAERAVGSFVQSFFGESLVCMQAASITDPLS